MPLLQKKAASDRGRQRIWLLAAGMVIGILVLAYIDGGEKPIRPMVQSVNLTDGPTGAATRSE